VIRHSRYSSTVLSGTYHIATHRDVSTKERRAAELPVRVAVGCCEAHVSCCMVCHSATAALCTKHCAALHCAALHCTALHCTALHCMEYLHWGTCQLLSCRCEWPRLHHSHADLTSVSRASPERRQVTKGMLCFA
jgi:hypothetical protein